MPHLQGRSFKKPSLLNPMIWIVIIMFPFVLVAVAGIVAIVTLIVQFINGIGSCLLAISEAFVEGLYFDYEILTGKELKPKGSPENED